MSVHLRGFFTYHVANTSTIATNISRRVNHPSYRTSIWKVSIEVSLNTSKRSQHSLCCGFSDFTFLPLNKTSSSSFTHPVSKIISLNPGSSLYLTLAVCQSRLKAFDVVILQQLYHFLPTDSTEPVCPHEKKSCQTHTASFNGCFFRCRITVDASVDDAAQMTSLP